MSDELLVCNLESYTPNCGTWRFKIWYVYRNNWRSLGERPNRRFWFYRTWHGGNMFSNSYGVGFLGLQLMLRFKKKQAVVDPDAKEQK